MAQASGRRLTQPAPFGGPTKENHMTTSRYTFYAEGLNREIEATASTEREAYQKVWNSLTDEQKNQLVILDCVDVESFV
jgi:hypothetical protein